MLPTLHVQSLDHSRESEYVCGSWWDELVSKGTHGNASISVTPPSKRTEWRGQDNCQGSLASSLPRKENLGLRFRERPCSKGRGAECSEDTYSLLAFLHAHRYKCSFRRTRQTSTMVQFTSPQTQTKMHSGKQQSPGLPVSSNKPKPKVSDKFSHKVRGHAFLNLSFQITTPHIRVYVKFFLCDQKQVCTTACVLPVVLKGPKRVPCSLELELELQAAGHLAWVLGPKGVASERTQELLSTEAPLQPCTSFFYIEYILLQGQKW